MKQEITKWEPLEREMVFEKYSRGIERVRFEMPDKRKEDYYLMCGNHSVAILALTEDEDIILVKQYRPGPDRVLVEMPGGAVEKGEDIKKAAERELLEETGYAGDLKVVASVFDDAYSTVERHCAVATDCRKVGDQKLDQTEFIEVDLVSLQEFRDILRNGRMTDVELGYMALDHLGLL